jgi:outer membrane murein-binding lipoprotein Lpp
MTIYEIDQALLSLIDPDTGEIGDYDMFCELQMEREAKVENMALWIKNLNAEADAIKAEKDNLADREKAARNKADRLKKYLAEILCGEKFTSPRVAVTFRKSEAVEIDEDFIEWAREKAGYLLKYKDPEVNKTAIKEAIKNGTAIEFARIVQNNNIQIK